ncbi:MAG: helix-turn-helix domain-containing protein [Acidobacteriota bacterium]
MNREPLLTAADMLVYLRLGSESALYRLIREHHLPFRRVGRLYRFDRRDVDAWTCGFASALEQERAQRPRIAS